MTSTMKAQAMLRPQPGRLPRTGLSGVAMRSLVAVRVMTFSLSVQVGGAGAGEPVLGEGDRYQDDEKRHGQRRGVAELEAAERHVVDVVLEHARGVHRAALGGDGDGVEDLERSDDADDEHER